MRHLFWTLALLPLMSLADDVPAQPLQGLADDMAALAQTAKEQRANIDYLPYIMTVFDGKELAEAGASSLKEALSLVGGVTIASDNLSLFNPIIRGSNPTAYGQSKLIVDGVEVNDLFFDGYTAYLAMPIDMIKRIEIVKGPGSYSNGHWGYAGSIIVTTRKAERSLDNDGVWFASVGSDVTRRAGAVFSTTFDEWTLAADVYTVHDNLWLNYGYDALSNNLFGASNADLSRSGDAPAATDATMASLSLSNGRWFFDGRLSSYRHGSGGGINYALATDDDHYNVDQWSLRSGLRYGVGTFNGKFEASVTQDSFSSRSLLVPAGLELSGVTYDDGFYGIHDAVIRTYRFNNTLSGELYGGDFTFGLGGSWSSTQSERTITTDRTTGSGMTDYSSTLPFVDPDGFIREMQAYASYERPLSDRWAGYVSLTFDKRNGLYGRVDPRVAAVYTYDSDNTLKFSISHAHRNPSWQEMFTLNNRARQGNPELKPESVWAYETEWTHRFEPEHTLSLNLFRLENHDQIYLSNYRYVNGSESTITGSEIEWRKRHDDTTFYAAYTHLWAEDGNGDTLPYAPSDTARAFVTHHFNQHWYGSAAGRWQGPTPRTADDTRSDMDAVTVVDLSAGYRLPCFNAEVQLTLKNVFDADERYPSPAGTYDDDYPAVGRALLLTLRGTF